MSKYEAGTFDDIGMRTLLKIIDGLEMSPREFFRKVLIKTISFGLRKTLISAPT
jgi:hypothetical protein